MVYLLICPKMFDAFVIYLCGLFVVLCNCIVMANDYRLLLTAWMVGKQVDLQCGPGHVCVHTAERMWPHATQTTSECGPKERSKTLLQGAVTPGLKAEHPRHLFQITKNKALLIKLTMTANRQ